MKNKFQNLQVLISLCLLLMGIGRQLHAFTYIAVFENHTITIADGEKFIDGKKFEYNAALNTYCSVIRNVVHDAAKLIQEAKIPEAYYNSENAGYAGNWLHTPPLPTGVADGAVEEIKSIPLLVSYGADVAMNAETRRTLVEGLKKLDAASVTGAVKEALENWASTYKNGGDKAWHQGGKDAVAIYTGYGAAKAALAGLKKLEKKAGDIAEAVGKVGKLWKAFLDDTFTKLKRAEVIAEGLPAKFSNLTIDELTAIKVYTSNELRNGSYIYKTLNTELRAGNLSDCKTSV